MSRPLEDRDERLRATTDLSRSLSVEASAGTGKTSLIVGRVLALIETGAASIGEMAVITFTEKAAAELEERVRIGIEARLAELPGASGSPGGDAAARLRRAHADLDRASIQTIHAFATSLLRRRPVEAGVDPRFSVADAAGQRFLFEDTWERFVAGEAAGPNVPLARVLAAGAPLDKVRDLAERFVENRDLSENGAPPRTPPPGDPRDVARELSDWIAAQVRELAPLCRDPQDRLFVNLHDVVAYARQVAALPELRARRALLQNDPKAISRSLGRGEAWLRDGKSRARDLADAWTERFGAYRAASDRHVTGEAAFWLRGFLDAYEARKKRDGLLDFQDLLLLARRLLRRPGMAAELRRVYRFVLVDEFQDTDPLQVEIAALLTGAGDGEDWKDRVPLAGSLFVVGDPKQSIYRFRRADLTIYDEACAWLDRASVDGARIAVTANFRSRPGVTTFVNATFGRLFTGFEETPSYSRLDPRRPEGTGCAVAFLVPESDGPVTGDTRDPREKREAEAALIARALRRGIEGERWRTGAGVAPGADPDEEGERAAGYGDVALLLRSFTDVALYEDALQDEGIACQTAMGRRYFLRPEVAWFISLLRAIESPHDEVAVVAALRSPFFGLPDEALLRARLGAVDASAIGASGRGRRTSMDPLRPDAVGGDVARALAALGQWHGARHDAPVGVVVRRLLHESSALGLLALREDGERSLLNLLKVADLARRHESDGGTFRTFVRWLVRARVEEFEQQDAALVEASRDAVQIMTIHAAKGLEFPIVVLPDLNRKISPKETFLIDRRSGRIAFRLEGAKSAMGGKDVSFRSDGYVELFEREKPILAAERQRLLYVAATRARDLLVIPLPEPSGRIDKESFLGDLSKAGALPDGASLGASRDGATMALPNGAGARLERIPTISAAGAVRTLPLTEVETDARSTRVADWRRERRARLDEASRAPAFLTASGRTEDSGETQDGLGLAAGARTALASDLPEIAVTNAERARARIEDARETARATARRFGIAVHAVLEAADFADPSSIGALAAWQAQVQRLPQEASRIERASRGALALSTVVEARDLRKLREVPVAFVEDGVLIEGQIDLVVERRDGALLVADFKTDAVSSLEEARERAADYAPQLALYARALERATGRRVTETAVLFVAAGYEIRAPHDDTARALARQAIARIAQ